MRMRLLSYREVPPGGYRYTVPETGHLVHSWGVDSWVDQCKRHLASNNIPVSIDLQQQMEAQFCEILPPGWCEHDDPNRPRVSTDLYWSDVERGSAAFLDWATSGRETVPQEEANRRAKICAGCYMNSNASGCGKSCRELLRRVFGLFTGRETPYDAILKNCSVCKCVIAAKVHFPLTVIEAHDNPEFQRMFPIHCWCRKDSPNYHA
jgi:hypothetical protein